MALYGVTVGFPASMESSGQTGQPTAADWQEKVYQRVRFYTLKFFLKLQFGFLCWCGFMYLHIFTMFGILYVCLRVLFVKNIGFFLKYFL